jgi:hypothetical protein
MKKIHPTNDWPFWILVILLTVLAFFSIRSFANAEPDTDTGILDSMIGYKVRDFNYNTVYTVTPTPSGDFIVRDPKYGYPLFKVEGGTIYNYKREPQRTIKNEKGQAIPK